MGVLRQEQLEAELVAAGEALTAVQKRLADARSVVYRIEEEQTDALNRRDAAKLLLWSAYPETRKGLIDNYYNVRASDKPRDLDRSWIVKKFRKLFKDRD